MKLKRHLTSYGLMIHSTGAAFLLWHLIGQPVWLLLAVFVSSLFWEFWEHWHRFDSLRSWATMLLFGHPLRVNVRNESP